LRAILALSRQCSAIYGKQRRQPRADSEVITDYSYTSAGNATSEPPYPAEHGPLNAAQVNPLPESAFAFPRSRKEPMTDASYVRNAVARLDQVEDVSDAGRELAFANIQKSRQILWRRDARTDWRQLGSRR
jgi:hypothetical protein